MKKIFSFIIILFWVVNVFGQYPEAFNYQAVARNNDGTPLVNKQIAVEVSVLRGTDCINSNGCQLIWQELHFPVTNEFGLFNIEIGNGENTFEGSASSFSDIDWNNFSSGNYYLKIRVDFGNSEYGNSMQELGIVKFLSVPYSLATKDVARDTSGKLPFNLTELADVNLTSLQANQILQWNGNQWVNVTATSGGAVSLNDLTDVSLGTVQNGDFLFFDGNNWVNYIPNLDDLADVTVNAGGGEILRYNGSNWVDSTLRINELTDVNISSPSNGEALVWNGTQWTNQTVSGGSSLWTQSGSAIYYNSGNVGVGTASPSYLFHVEGGNNGIFTVSGTFDNTATAPNLGAGSYLFFYPARGVLRAGVVTGTQWNTMGNYSIATGLDNSATNTYSVSFGHSNTSSGVASVTMGESNTASADYSFAGGLNSSATGVRAFAYGEGLEAVAYLSAVFGRYNASSTQNPTTWYGSNQLFVLGNGSDASNRHNAMVVLKDGTLQAQGSVTGSVSNPEKATNFNEEALPMIMKLVPVQEQKNNGIVYGFLYNNIKEVFPGMVYDFNQNEHTFAYARVVPVLVKALQEQQSHIDKLEAENKNLNKKLSELEQRISALENK